MDATLQDRLTTGLECLGLPLNPAQIQQLVGFIKLITKWNKTYNLTAIRHPEEMADRHILDSLAIAPFIQGQRIVDIGTGAGIPGIPLAIALPDKTFVLLDCNAKKTRFVQQAILELKLPNASVCHHRAEHHRPDPLFDTVLSRAFASLADIVALAAHLTHPNGIMLAMKGRPPEQELAEIGGDLKADIIPIRVPGSAAQRCLVKLTGYRER